MLRYNSVVTSALTDEVTPVLLDAIAAACGPDWFSRYGLQIISQYEHFDSIRQQLSQGVAPEAALDLSALMFLLSPPSGTPVPLDAIQSRVARHYQLASWQQAKLSRIRSIRNNAVHDKLDSDRTYNEQDIRTGVQEKKWLAELEEAVGILKPGFQLAKYQKELARRIESDNPDPTVQAYSIYQSITEPSRPALRAIGKFDFVDAPIGAPLEGPAPWAESGDDLQQLAWPAPNAFGGYGSGIPTDLSSLGNAVDALTGALDKGVNKVLTSLFGRRK